MRARTIRAALPAVAVAAALVLTGCNGDEEESPSDSAPSEDAGQGGEQDGEQGADAGQEGGGAEQEGDGQGGEAQGAKPEDLSQIDPASLPTGISPEDLVDLVPDDLTDLIPWEELEELGITDPGEEDDLPPATVEELQGNWSTGPDLEDAFLSFAQDEVTFFEDWGAEGDICYGTATEGALALDDCSLWGEEEWTATSATLAFDGPTLVVTWEDGTVQEYYNDQAMM
ncbi:hypothetical protein [Streptomyces sp. 6N223]|uniref:hypothetical protein n=1 Tax=Streptomyces sp. 6N223 TaxID=3457412 RepID=UPI003FD18752